ncbi:hypothetical protein C8R43DRAFT_949435 [Mycena crocata]|nr:hypothetical protein C8R43DRAFT_949435 [Mycena crocata]
MRGSGIPEVAIKFNGELWDPKGYGKNNNMRYSTTDNFFLGLVSGIPKVAIKFNGELWAEMAIKFNARLWDPRAVGSRRGGGIFFFSRRGALGSPERAWSHVEAHVGVVFKCSLFGSFASCHTNKGISTRKPSKTHLTGFVKVSGGSLDSFMGQIEVRTQGLADSPLCSTPMSPQPFPQNMQLSNNTSSIMEFLNTQGLEPTLEKLEGPGMLTGPAEGALSSVGELWKNHTIAIVILCIVLVVIALPANSFELVHCLALQVKWKLEALQEKYGDTLTAENEVTCRGLIGVLVMKTIEVKREWSRFRGILTEQDHNISSFTICFPSMWKGNKSFELNDIQHDIELDKLNRYDACDGATEYMVRMEHAAGSRRGSCSGWECAGGVWERWCRRAADRRQVRRGREPRVGGGGRRRGEFASANPPLAYRRERHVAVARKETRRVCTCKLSALALRTVRVLFEAREHVLRWWVEAGASDSAETESGGGVGGRARQQGAGMLWSIPAEQALLHLHLDEPWRAHHCTVLLGQSSLEDCLAKRPLKPRPTRGVARVHPLSVRKHIEHIRRGDRFVYDPPLTLAELYVDEIIPPVLKTTRAQQESTPQTRWEEKGLAADYPDWGNTSKVLYSFAGLMFPKPLKTLQDSDDE